MKVLESSTRIGFKNILLLTDLSQASEGAMQYAAALAKHFDAAFYTGHVHAPLVSTYVDAGMMLRLDEPRDVERQHVEALTASLPVSPHILLYTGVISSAVTQWTVEHGIDLIVIGTHGWRGWHKLLLGSAAEEILRTATCPVLTVGPHVAVTERRPEYIDRVLFATDLTPASEHAIPYALSFAHERCAELKLLHVMGRDIHVPDRERVTEYCEYELRRLVPEQAMSHCVPEFSVLEGDAAEDILLAAEHDDSDLIVLGLPRVRALGSLLRTSVTYRVICGAPCPVLTIRDSCAN